MEYHKGEYSTGRKLVFMSKHLNPLEKEFLIRQYKSNTRIKKGAIYENMVGEALIKQGYKLFYYKKEDSTLEADFLIRSTASLIPDEVKAKSGRAKSMKTLIASDHYPDIRYGIKLSKNNIGHEDRIYTFPYFCTFLLKRFMVGFHAEEEAE